MERDRQPVATFLAGAPLSSGTVARLDEGAAHHVRVRRLAVGDRVRLTDGAGCRAFGTIGRIAKAEVEVSVESTEYVARAPAIHLFVPVADRDRMLWLAEKATELGVAVWQPVVFARSRSVSPRGEGAAFREKVAARMRGALEQSGVAWLPEVRAEMDAGAVTVATDSTRILLDAAGAPLSRVPLEAPVAIILGPEGGLEESERATLVGNGWGIASLGSATLRFETAAIAATAIVSAQLASP